MSFINTWTKNSPTLTGYYWIDHDMIGEKIVIKIGDAEEERNLAMNDQPVYIQDGDEFEFMAYLEDFEKENAPFNYKWRFIEPLEDKHTHD